MTQKAIANTSERYTGEDYLASNPDWHEEDAAWKVEQARRLVSHHSVPVRSFCDVGCGTGLCTELLRSVFPGAEAEGFEFSPVALQRAVAREKPGLRFFQASPFDKEKRYDLAVSFDVMEHVENPFDFVRGLARIAPVVLVHIPLDMNVLAVMREWPILGARDDVGHLHYFSRGTALALLREGGLDPIDEIYTPWAIDQSHKTTKKRIAALPRRMAFKLAPHGAVRLIGGWSLMVLARSRLFAETSPERAEQS